MNPESHPGCRFRPRREDGPKKSQTFQHLEESAGRLRTGLSTDVDKGEGATTRQRRATTSHLTTTHRLDRQRTRNNITLIPRAETGPARCPDDRSARVRT